jgi:hypothetical protein
VRWRELCPDLAVKYLLVDDEHDDGENRQHAEHEELGIIMVDSSVSSSADVSIDALLYRIR